MPRRRPRLFPVDHHEAHQQASNRRGSSPNRGIRLPGDMILGSISERQKLDPIANVVGIHE